VTLFARHPEDRRAIGAMMPGDGMSARAWGMLSEKPSARISLLH
jgi:hypothetical protein